MMPLPPGPALTHIPTCITSQGGGGTILVINPADEETNNKSPSVKALVFNPLTKPCVVTYPIELVSIS